MSGPGGSRPLLERAVPAVLLVAGSIVFLWGGALHPATGPELGPLGSDTYFRSFARHVLEHPAWQAIHTGILAGPVLWALGCLGLPRALAAGEGSRFLAVGRGALLMGAVTWSVTFVVDGFVAPVLATAVVQEGVTDAGALLAFRASQEVVIRLGLVSWLLLATGIAGLGAEIVRAGRVRRSLRLALGIGGLLVGLWSLAAWALGIFRPGPFTSDAWVPTAVVSALWFLVLGGAAAIARHPVSSSVPAGQSHRGV